MRAFYACVSGTLPTDATRWNNCIADVLTSRGDIEVIIRSPRNNPSHSCALIAVRVSLDVTVISFMSMIPMLHVFVFPSVTDVGITRHRQNTYLPGYARRWRRAAVVAGAGGLEEVVSANLIS